MDLGGHLRALLLEGEAPLIFLVATFSSGVTRSTMPSYLLTWWSAHCKAAIVLGQSFL